MVCLMIIIAPLAEGALNQADIDRLTDRADRVEIFETDLVCRTSTRYRRRRSIRHALRSGGR